MSPQAFIFIGRSGCGKGTQVELLKQALKRSDPSRDILYIQTGQGFRDFIKGDTYTQNKSREIYEAGGLQPEFLAIQMWEKPLIDGCTGEEHIILDGTPRKYHEAGVLDSVFGFYNIETVWVINVDISPEESLKRLLLRKRFDDNTDEIKKRLAWYETDVAPAVDFFRTNKNYRFLKIDGERSVEAIHADIVKQVGLE
jgi:adenylate kinase